MQELNYVCWNSFVNLTFISHKKFEYVFSYFQINKKVFSLSCDKKMVQKLFRKSFSYQATETFQFFTLKLSNHAVNWIEFKIYFFDPITFSFRSACSTCSLLLTIFPSLKFTFAQNNNNYRKNQRTNLLLAYLCSLKIRIGVKIKIRKCQVCGFR